MTADSGAGRMHDETVALAGRALGGPLAAVEFLGGSPRSIVCRARTSAGSVVPAGTTVVVKRFVDDPVPPEFTRELTGLGHLERTPTLLASEPEHGLLVMSDLGDWPTLADLLLGEDSHAAATGAREWARALGELVGASAPSAPAVAEQLERQNAAENPALPVRQLLSDGVDRLRELAGAPSNGSGSVGASRALDDEQLAAVAALARPGGSSRSQDSGSQDPGRAHAVVWPGDTCPDNAVRTSSGWRFLDLEGTSVNHPALVAAYTVLPFATCWCVFDPPPGLTAEMYAAFTAGLRRHVPDAVAEPEWSRQVDLAAAAWVLMTSGLLVQRARDEEPRRIGPEDRPAPTGRQLLAARWRWGARRLSGTVPAIAALCAEAADWADRTWGPDAAPIGPYPAFA